ncbi:hypothetical protein RND81_09G073100 [Saponaria officinalis]|uniref:SWIM-type domain-containing protein n=1 Tax=Saponaria officinalis TaxID=3572 RepID=A0AAW1IHV4_SAPOF
MDIELNDQGFEQSKGDDNDVVDVSVQNQDSVQGERNGDVADIITKENTKYSINDDIEITGSLVGMKAKEWKHLLIVYRRHAQAMGFSARIGTCRRKNGVESPEYERASIRTQINSEGLWEVLDHKIDHNHPLTPTQWQHHHRSERKITREEGEIIEIMTEAMVPPSVQYRVAAATSGGEEFVGHTKRDHINFVNRLKMHAIEGGDASTLVNLLNKRQTEEPGFFYRVQFGEEGRLCHLFWRDSMMKEDYLLYHDMVIFDTTYRTNRYNLICGAFVGINNHWSNVMFGCAFLSDEKTESFEWLFNAFNESMSEDVIPLSIFTDQDLAMTNAIEKVYPISKHRLCQWHIHQNAVSHFGSLKHDRTFQNAFNKCLNGCYSEEEFQDTWGRMIEEYGLQNNLWFQRLYGLKEKWCTAFNKDIFSAGILSSQRSESTNHAMGFQASKTTSLTDFFHIFEATVKRWRTEEERNEFNCIRSRPTSVYPVVDLLDHAAQVYTLALFRVFEKEFGMAIGTRVVECASDESLSFCIVHSSGSFENAHQVTFDRANLTIECTCLKFSKMGMLCYHSIRILHLRSITEIPDRYILKRWTKFAKKDVWDRLLPNDRRRVGINDAINWRRESLTNFNNLITKCQNVAEARTILDQAYTKANDAVQAFFNTTVDVECPTSFETPTTSLILDPQHSTTKGRSRRKKSGITKRKTRGTKQSQTEAASYTPIPRLF